MKKLIATITAIAIAAPAVAATETPSISALFQGLVVCEDRVAEVGLLNQEEAATCMSIYEALKASVAPNHDTSTQEGRNAQYLEYQEWRQANEAAFREVFE